LTNYSAIPLKVYFDTETKIIASDYRAHDSMFTCIDQDGNLILRNLQKEKEFKKIKLNYDKYNFVQFNRMNDFQYFVSSQNSFRIFDIRTYYELENIEEFKNSSEIINDTKNFLLGYRDKSLSVYQTDLLKGGYSLHNNWKDILNVSCINMNTKYFDCPDLIALGNENGDLFYSDIN